MDLTDEQKVTVLLNSLSERHNSIHIIRGRVQTIAIWILGLFITAAGWIVQSTHSFEIRDKILYSLGILVTIVFLRVFYLRDLEKGFKVQQQILARIENILGLCQPGVFSQESVYPEEWSKAGTKNGKGSFFSHNYLLIYLGTIILLISIWLK